MKKIGILNQPLSAAIAGLGHMDTLVVADAGLPIPAEPQRIDLALRAGIPAFVETVAAILEEMEVERAVVAEEMAEVSPALFAALKELLGDLPVETVSHEVFKERSRTAEAIVRTGEFTPYANVMLVAGVVF